MAETTDLNNADLEEQAMKRKERLKALKRRRETGLDDKTTDKIDTPPSELLPKPKFRSYQPTDDELKENSIAQTQVTDISQEVKDHIESAKTKVIIDELDITNLAPRKPDWDLKRDVAKKLEKLERRTQKAIAELIRERLKQQSHT